MNSPTEVNSSEETKKPSSDHLHSRPESHEYIIKSNILFDLAVDDEKRLTTNSVISKKFRDKLKLSLRVGIGVLVAGMIQTREVRARIAAERGNSTISTNQWLLLPENYFLGGLSYAAVTVVLSVGQNAGETIRSISRNFTGVSLALIYNMLLFLIIPLTQANLVDISLSFSGQPYKVSQTDFYTFLPFIMIYTFLILLSPMSLGTKQFALGMNLSFSLSIISPMDPYNPKALKGKDGTFNTSNIIKNLAIYFVVGLAGSLISFLTMFIPYPLMATNQLMNEVKFAEQDVTNLLNIIVDCYCFKNKDVEKLDFIQMKLDREFKQCNERLQKLVRLVDDSWWEQLIGFHICSKFDISIIKQYVKLYGSLIEGLRSMKHAMKFEKYNVIHSNYMMKLQQHIYILQIKSSKLLHEITMEIMESNSEVSLESTAEVHSQLERSLSLLEESQRSLLGKRTLSKNEVISTIPLNLFIFSLVSFCNSLMDFEYNFNQKSFDTKTRAYKFLQRSCKKVFIRGNYETPQIISACKISLSILLGIFLAVFVFDFKPTIPAAIAYIMGNTVGGSYSTTLIRVSGVVAGGVIPSVFSFFACHICNSVWQNLISNIFLLFWTCISMHVYYSGGNLCCIGLISAFVAVDILLTQCSCRESSTATSTYASLAQNSVGMFIFFTIELLVFPQSAVTLLKQNIRSSFSRLKVSFNVLFNRLKDISMQCNNIPVAGVTVNENEEFKMVQDFLVYDLPASLMQQVSLIKEAKAEPLLWRPPHTTKKYDLILKESIHLLNNLKMLLELIQWFSIRVRLIRRCSTTEYLAGIGNQSSFPNENSSSFVLFQRFLDLSTNLEAQISDVFDMIMALFSSDFSCKDAKATAAFIQLKEAFRKADRDGNGMIDSKELFSMLERILNKNKSLSKEDVEHYVATFMESVDTDESGTVSFTEFMEALDNGLQIEMEVYQAIKKNQSSQQLRESLSLLVEEEEIKEQEKCPVALIKRSATAFAGDSFLLVDGSIEMKMAFVEWLVGQPDNIHEVKMEHLLFYNCFVSGTEGIAHNLKELQVILAS